MDIILYMLVFVSTTLIIVVFYQLFFTDKQLIFSRMEAIRASGSSYSDEDDLKKPFFERVVEPLYDRFVNGISKLTPKGLRNSYDTLIIQAGKQKVMTPSNLVSKQILLGVVLTVLIFGLTSLTGNVSLFSAVLAFLIGVYAPYYQYKVYARKRQEGIQLSLPNFLDLLYVSVEAGLGFDMAMKRSAEKMTGPLTEEVKIVLDDISKGRNRSEALRSLTKRTGVEDLNSFVTAVIQADQLGSNIANMLRIQSNTMRQKRRQRVEESVAKLPVKMILPLVFFFIPAIFIVVLGPAVLNTLEVLRGVL